MILPAPVFLAKSKLRFPVTLSVLPVNVSKSVADSTWAICWAWLPEPILKLMRAAWLDATAVRATNDVNVFVSMFMCLVPDWQGINRFRPNNKTQCIVFEFPGPGTFLNFFYDEKYRLKRRQFAEFI
jgi:hypothetical protein